MLHPDSAPPAKPARRHAAGVARPGRAPASNPRFRLYGSAASYAIVAQRVLTGRWDRGDDPHVLEREVQARVGVSHAMCVAKARVGIFLAIRALVKPGQQVILSPYTISDVVNMVVCAGGVPVFADIEADTCNIDPVEVSRLIGLDTGAVLVTHLHGLACDMDAIGAACRTHRTALVEDAAQALGTRFAGRPVGTFGDAGIFSFGMYKNVNAFFGGMIVANGDALAARLREEIAQFPVQERGYYLRKLSSGLATDLATFPPLFKALTFHVFRHAFLNDLPRFRRAIEFDLHPHLKRVLPESYLRRMSATQAYLALRQINAVDEESRARIAAAHRYHEGFEGLHGLRRPPLRGDLSHTYSYYPVQVEDRTAFLKELVRAGRDVAAQHLRNCADVDCFAEFARDCPVARQVSQRLVLLPTYPRYGIADVDRTISAVRTVMGH